MVRVGRDLKAHPVPPLALGRDTSHQTRLLQAPSSLALNPSRDGAATASLGNLGQALTTFTPKNFFLRSHLNLPSFSVKPFPLVLWLPSLIQSPSPSLLEPLEGLEGVAVQTGDLLPCKICGRTFFPAALKKHGPICQKTSAKKRKTFDSSRQRAEGTDIPTVKPLKPRPEPPKKPSNWRRKHEEFIATIRAAKGLNLKDGGKLPPPPPPSYDPDYIQCPYCQRRFNENAADRHINFCKEQAARITNKGKLAADTKGKLPTRTQYKPAAVKKMPSVGSTPPSSSSRLPQPSGVTKTVVVTENVLYLGLFRSDGKTGYDHPSSVNGGNAKGSEGNSPIQLSKFCHECGTRYPVEWAKFCCECGIRRMVV
uniref:Zinc finger C2HC domain-containing protein 1A n=1 Tax=Calidris pygmaea TaxID=425635 RepID=A0A8C3JRC5_9CHAR